MEALNYNYPVARKVDTVFPTFDSPKPLLDLAKKRGFYNGNAPENKLFNEWFFGELKETPQFKKGVDETNAQKAMNWAVCFMRSFAPKHEEKEAICALIFSEALEVSPTHTT